MAPGAPRANRADHRNRYTVASYLGQSYVPRTLRDHFHRRFGPARISDIVLVLVHTGPPAVSAVQTSARRWTVRITAPEDWTDRVRDGLGPWLDDPKGRPGLVLDYRDRDDGLRDVWVLRQPHRKRSIWIVARELHSQA